MDKKFARTVVIENHLSEYSDLMDIIEACCFSTCCSEAFYDKDLLKHDVKLVQSIILENYINNVKD